MIISIHLMLLFIIAQSILSMCFLYFNTSHVTVYLVSVVPVNGGTYFNTSHVTVYHPARRPSVPFPRISIHLMLLFIDAGLYITYNQLNFNTSHVTVYQFQYHQVSIVLAFQYISCYCLSENQRSEYNGRLISIHLMLLFISTQAGTSLRSINFNTSHVTVYLAKC